MEGVFVDSGLPLLEKKREKRISQSSCLTCVKCGVITGILIHALMFLAILILFLEDWYQMASFVVCRIMLVLEDLCM